jgi:hypothetical protein
MKKPTDPMININESEYKALIERVRASSLGDQDRKWLISILETFRFVQLALEQKKVALHKLRELLFGKKTEKDKNLNNLRAATVFDGGVAKVFDACG